jgi:hypothetical protein
MEQTTPDDEEVTTGGELNHTNTPLPLQPEVPGQSGQGNVLPAPVEDTAMPEYPDPETAEEED